MERALLHLRAATASSHAALEETLDLLARPLSRARFHAALQGFEAFHRAWEPDVESWIADPTFMAPRRKAALAAKDLAALGGGPDLALPVDLSFLDGASAAWGSLYVMEGATLGGKVISRALEAAPWLPTGGLGYFDPYGPLAGAMWRAFRGRLETAALNLPAAAAAAQATFAAVEAAVGAVLRARRPPEAA